MAVRMPSTSTAQVMRYDTTQVTVDAGMMGNITMDVLNDGTVDLAFAETAAGLQVTAAYSAFNGMMTNPMAGNINVDESDIGGQLVFTLDERGRAEVTESFEVSGEVAQMVGSKTLAYDLFPRFPDGTVMPGAMWVDTLTMEEAGDFTMSQTTVVTSTLVGDTVVDGRALLRINHTADVEMTTIGEQQGMSMSQDMSGTNNGWTLWDPAASLPFASYSETELGGIVSVDMAGAGDMALSMSGRTHSRLVY